MTLIVGIRTPQRVYMGADCLASSGWLNKLRRDEKMFRLGPFLIGCTTSYRMIQLIRYKMNPPTPVGDPLEFMVSTFVERLRETLKEGGFSKIESNREEGGDFLVAYGNNLFTVEGNFQVEISDNEYSVVGCGDQLALGSLFSSGNLHPKKRISQAIHAASAFSPFVSKQHFIKKTRTPLAWR